MNPWPENEEKLERLVHRTLRELPSRPAPASLEERVFAEIRRRAALPWWRKNFAHWPLAARAAFIVVSGALIRLAFAVGVWVMAGFDSAQLKATLAHDFRWVESSLAVVNAVTDFCDIMLRNIPPLWLYGGLAFIATMYLALFGLGAAAFRALHAER